MPTPKVLRLVGGGKRARGQGEVVPSATIPVIVGSVELLDSDIQSVRTALRVNSFDIDAWLGGLNGEKLRNLDNAADKYVNTGGTDTAIRAFAEKLPELEALQDATTSDIDLPSSQSLTRRNPKVTSESGYPEILKRLLGNPEVTLGNASYRILRAKRHILKWV